MTVSELLTQITRIFFIFLSAVTLIDFIRYRDRVRRDVAAVFGCVATTILLSIVMSQAGIEDQGLRRIGSLVLLAQPYLLLRIVSYFRPINKIVHRIAVVGLAAAVIALLTVINQAVLPALVTLVLIAYFTLIDGYAVYAFIQGAVSSVGVVRNRLRLAAAGSALLITVLLVAGLRTFLPGLAPFAIPVTQILAVLSTLAYFLSFATPRWLRQAWQLGELRDFLQEVQAPSARSRAEVLVSLSEAVRRALSTDSVAMLLADETDKMLHIDEASTAPALVGIPTEVAIWQSWTQREAQILYRSAGTDEDQRFLAALDCEAMLAVPIATQARGFGVLVVCLAYGSLFVDDDVRLLTLFAQQTAILLENDAALGAMQRYTEDLEQEVKQRTAALARSNDELRQFAYVASHDLKEPLRTITSYVQLIERNYAESLDDDGREFINFAVAGAARMKALIDDLLIYARVEQQEHHITAVDVQPILDDTLQQLETSIEEAEATITSDAMPQIRADEQLIAQLFQNLISNALKYRGNRKPVVHVGAQQRPGEWLFSVCDNGIGIEADYQERIFVIFQRLQSQDEYSGTGIGLAVCKKAVEIHEGRIWVESEPGVGSTFYFTIPM